jgi:hypothetical protein
VDVNDLDLLWPGFRPDEAEPELVVMRMLCWPWRFPLNRGEVHGSPAALTDALWRLHRVDLAHGEAEIAGNAVLLARDDERSGRAKRRTAGGVAPGDSGWWLFCIAVDVAAEKGGLN